MTEENKDGGTGLTAVDSVSVSVPTPELSHDAPELREGPMDKKHLLHSEFDAAIWAREFVATNKTFKIAESEATMLGWFANAIMAGYDEANRRSHAPELLEALKALKSRIEELSAVKREGITGAAYDVMTASIGDDITAEFLEAEEAIAKAEGRS